MCRWNNSTEWEASDDKPCLGPFLALIHERESGVVIDGAPELWRQVLARHPRNIGHIVNVPARS